MKKLRTVSTQPPKDVPILAKIDDFKGAESWLACWITDADSLSLLPSTGRTTGLTVEDIVAWVPLSDILEMIDEEGGE